MFYELAEGLLWGLRALGYEASLGTNAFSELSTNIVLGAGLIPEQVLAIMPKGSIIYNTEQIDSQEPWARTVLPKLATRCETWD